MNLLFTIMSKSQSKCTSLYDTCCIAFIRFMKNYDPFAEFSFIVFFYVQQFTHLLLQHLAEISGVFCVYYEEYTVFLKKHRSARSLNY